MGIYAIKDLGRFTLFSSVVVQPTLLGRSSEQPGTLEQYGYDGSGRVVRAFAHAVGQLVPGTRRCATRLDTNMMVAAQIVDETMKARGLLWRIPAQTPAKFRLDAEAAKGPYTVTQHDVQEFVSATKMCFYSGGDKPFYELPLAARPVGVEEHDELAYVEDGAAVRKDSIGSWGQRLTDVNPPLPLRRLERFWWELQMPDRLPQLGGPLLVICAIETDRTRAVE